ncbi:unnamed protein product [Acanthocheilonema viteae]|uniref:Uncharacterized protein n=1 Tax=Acanthocheilonema viteae TaxID=6277 RepID=A0A498SK87_ACAVI|nr:unnamed protein product [Acanthocheilonema viteae]
MHHIEVKLYEKWLFRAQQCGKSPSGTLLFRAENNKNRAEYNGESTRYMATRVETINYGTKNGITVSGTSGYVHGNIPNISFAHNGNGGNEFNPVATEIDRCRLRTNNIRANCGGGTANASTRDCTNHCFQADFLESPTAAIFNTVRLSAVSTTDAHSLPQSNISGGATTISGTERSPGNMLSTLSTTGTQHSRSLTSYDPYVNNSFTTSAATSSNTVFAFNNNSVLTQSNLSTSPVNCATEILHVAHNKENGGSDTTESIEDWQMFAPFVAHDDMMQLSTDLQGLLPEFSVVDWVPSDPAPLTSLPVEERSVALLGNVSIPMQMALERSNVYANSGISLLSKPNPFGLTATSWRQLQQQYQQRHHENMNAEATTAATATPLLEVELAATYT